MFVQVLTALSHGLDHTVNSLCPITQGFLGSTRESA
jgi:hypothetical protein